MRTGYTDAIDATTQEGKGELTFSGRMAGLESSVDGARWPSARGLAAVVGDEISLKCITLKAEASTGLGIYIPRSFDFSIIVRSRGVHC